EPMLIGHPAKEPKEFVAALKGLFAQRPEVRRAYLAMIHIPSRDSAPNLLVAIETDGDLEGIVADCGLVATDTLERREAVDFAGISVAEDYFANDTPFYSRD